MCPYINDFPTVVLHSSPYDSACARIIDVYQYFFKYNGDSAKSIKIGGYKIEERKTKRTIFVKNNIFSVELKYMKETFMADSDSQTIDYSST